MKYLILFRETVIQEDTYCVSVEAESKDEAFNKASNGQYTNREVLYSKVLDSIGKNLIDIAKDE